MLASESKSQEKPMRTIHLIIQKNILLTNFTSYEDGDQANSGMRVCLIAPSYNRATEKNVDQNRLKNFV